MLFDVLCPFSAARVDPWSPTCINRGARRIRAETGRDMSGSFGHGTPMTHGRSLVSTTLEIIRDTELVKVFGLGKGSVTGGVHEE